MLALLSLALPVERRLQGDAPICQDWCRMIGGAEPVIDQRTGRPDFCVRHPEPFTCGGCDECTGPICRDWCQNMGDGFWRHDCTIL